MKSRSHSSLNRRRRTISHLAVLLSAALASSQDQALANITPTITQNNSVGNGESVSTTGPAVSVNGSPDYSRRDIASIGYTLIGGGPWTDYRSVATLTTKLTGNPPSIASNFCVASTSLTLSVPTSSLVYYRFSYSYSGESSLAQLAPGLTLSRGNQTLLDSGLSTSGQSSGTIDLSSGNPLILKSALSANVTTAFTGSFTTAAFVTEIPVSVVPIGGTQPTTGSAVWRNATNGNWSDQTNWMQNALPTSIPAVFNNNPATPYTVSLTGATSNSSTNIIGDQLAIALHGNVMSTRALNLFSFGYDQIPILKFVGPGTVNLSLGMTFDSGYRLNVDGAVLNYGASSTGSTPRGTFGIPADARVLVDNAGQINAGGLSVAYSGTAIVMVGDGSSLTFIGSGTGNVTNDGVIRLIATADAQPDTIYSPITTTSWIREGTVQAIGGTWISSSHVFVASSIAQGTAGTALNIDLSQTQRVRFTDNQTGKSLLAAFVGSSTASPLSFTATQMGEDLIANLEPLLAPDAQLNSAWLFSTTGYVAGTPVLLSFDIGPGFAEDGLSIWHYDGSTWTTYKPADLSYDGENASFTVTGFSGYAVTSIVPEPVGAVTSLGVVWLLLQRRQRSPAAPTA